MYFYKYILHFHGWLSYFYFYFKIIINLFYFFIFYYIFATKKTRPPVRDENNKHDGRATTNDKICPFAWSCIKHGRWEIRKQNQIICGKTKTTIPLQMSVRLYAKMRAVLVKPANVHHGGCARVIEAIQGVTTWFCDSVGCRVLVLIVLKQAFEGKEGSVFI